MSGNLAVSAKRWVTAVPLCVIIPISTNSSSLESDASNLKTFYFSITAACNVPSCYNLQHSDNHKVLGDYRFVTTLCVYIYPKG